MKLAKTLQYMKHKSYKHRYIKSIVVHTELAKTSQYIKHRPYKYWYIKSIVYMEPAKTSQYKHKPYKHLNIKSIHVVVHMELTEIPIEGLSLRVHCRQLLYGLSDVILVLLMNWVNGLH